MQRGLRNIAIVVSIVQFYLPLIADTHRSEEALFAQIQLHAEAGESSRVHAFGNEFHKKYPLSKRRGDVYLLMAKNAITVDSAVKYFGLAVKFLDGNRAMEARRNLCRVLQLASRWDDLKKEAARALNVVTDNAHRADFLLHLARAYIAEEEYEKAADVCEEIVKINAQSTQVLPALLMLSHAVRKQTGYSRDYFLVMRNIIEKFNRSESMPAALYLLGKAYYQRGDYHRAYSAFRELKTRFPRSPEASLAAEKISAIEKHNPKIVAFVPDDAFLQTLDKIDLSFDNLDEEALVKKKSFYAVMLGPVEEKREAMRIAREIKNEFTPVKIVHSAGGYAVYVGKHAMLANATVMKIRLAEEMGYNGKVVRFRIDRNKTYIYGE